MDSEEPCPHSPCGESARRANRKAHSKYQFMEVNTQRRLAGLKEKVPDIQKTLEMVRFLSKRKVGSTVMPMLQSLGDS